MGGDLLREWVAVALAAAGGLVVVWRRASYDHEVEQIRQRLRQELRLSTPELDIRLPDADPPPPPPGLRPDGHSDGQPDPDSADRSWPAGDYNGEPAGPKTRHVTGDTFYNISVTQTPAAVEERRAEREEQRFSLLLTDYYAHGLTQAQRSSVMSLAFSAAGCLILFTGVALAILRSTTTGELYAAMATNVTGVVTGAVGLLFHRQARGAMDHLTAQTKLLRQDMRSERDTRQAIRMVDEVADPALRSRLQAALILRFTGAELPPADPPAPGA